MPSTEGTASPKEYRYEVRIAGRIRSNGDREAVERAVRNALHLSVAFYDSIDDFVVAVKQDDFDRLRGMKK